MSLRPHLIGVAGPSGAGKSTLARALAARLPRPALVLPMDAYYRDLGHLAPEARIRVNFDHPEALDHALFLRHLGDLAAGNAVDRPVYEFPAHTRARETERIDPVPFIVAEGLLALYWNDVRQLLATAVFVNLDDAACLARRLARDAAERGRSPESVRAQYAETVRPMRQRYVMPTRAFADVVVSGADPVEVSVQAVLAHVGGAEMRAATGR
jgi:uridine kinase